MKILFAADGKTMDAPIAKRFGHAEYYLIFDDETNELTARENHGHDDNHSELIELVNEGVKTFIIGNVGPHAFKVLAGRNGKMFLARKLTVREALEKFKNDELEELTSPTLKRSIEGHNH
ncbi:MAG: dinitrogenase iron-molybdenum cofactor biosynthesis protein [Chlorobi bacterium]|nr:dinitrogenase iron-molybdenum cofactor biosynthesis protein [Chlorobiota bacterium]